MICVTLTEDQADWILGAIRMTKENQYTGDDFDDAMDDWNPDHFDLHPEELDFLQSLCDVLTPNSR